MQRLEFSGAVRPIYGSLGVKRLKILSQLNTLNSTKLNRVSLTPCPLFLHSRPVLRTGGTAPNVRPHRVTAAFASGRTIQRWGSSGIIKGKGSPLQARCGPEGG